MNNILKHRKDFNSNVIDFFINKSFGNQLTGGGGQNKDVDGQVLEEAPLQGTMVDNLSNSY